MTSGDIITTERHSVVLSRITPETIGAYTRALVESQDPAFVSQFLDVSVNGDGNRVRAYKEALERLKDPDQFNMAIALGSTADAPIVGGASLRTMLVGSSSDAELICWLKEGEERKGYATVAVRALALRGREVFSAVYGHVPANNHRAIELAQRTGFAPDNRQRRNGTILFKFNKASDINPYIGSQKGLDGY